MRVVGIALVRNEDRFVEQSLRNVSSFCDIVVVADHMSTDGTWEIVRSIATANSLRRRSDVPSLEQSSTTISSRSLMPQVRTLRTTCAIVFRSLKQGMTTETFMP